MEFCKKYGLHTNTLARYERGERSPDAGFLKALVDAGYNANWILTGTGSIREATDDKARYGREPGTSGIDWELMQWVVETIETIVADIRRAVTPKMKARLIRALYQYYVGKARDNDGSTVQDRDGMANIVRIALETGDT